MTMKVPGTATVPNRDQSLRPGGPVAHHTVHVKLHTQTPQALVLFATNRQTTGGESWSATGNTNKEQSPYDESGVGEVFLPRSAAPDAVTYPPALR